VACTGQAAPKPIAAPDLSSIRLQIKAPSGSSEYRIGEIIPVELIFSTTKPQPFRVRLAPSFRQLGLRLDDIDVEPRAGWEDPLVGFQSCRPVLEGGLSEARGLSSDPQQISLILNEWVRFQNPGHYYLTVRSHRIIPIEAFPNMPLPSVESNRMLLDVIAPTVDWQAQTLNDAMRVLASTKNDEPEQREIRGRAMNTVRFLGTEGAALALSRLLASEPYSYELLTGLVASPARQTSAREMRRLLVDPNFPVVREFLCALALVGNSPTPGDTRASRQAALEARFREELRAALPKKIGTARDISSATVENQQ
jgi:hypothetical protein